MKVIEIEKSEQNHMALHIDHDENLKVKETFLEKLGFQFVKSPSGYGERQYCYFHPDTPKPAFIKPKVSEPWMECLRPERSDYCSICQNDVPSMSRSLRDFIHFGFFCEGCEEKVSQGNKEVLSHCHKMGKDDDPRSFGFENVCRLMFLHRACRPDDESYPCEADDESYPCEADDESRPCEADDESRPCEDAKCLICLKAKMLAEFRQSKNFEENDETIHPFKALMTLSDLFL
jgi:hypothetical protein